MPQTKDKFKTVVDNFRKSVTVIAKDSKYKKAFDKEKNDTLKFYNEDSENDVLQKKYPALDNKIEKIASDNFAAREVTKNIKKIQVTPGKWKTK